MELSVQRFADIVHALNLGDVKELGDKRRAERIPVQFEGQITPRTLSTAGRPVGVTIRDFSPRGVSIEQSQPMLEGDQFVLHMPNRNGGTTNILCSVINSHPSENGRHRAGAEFTCVVASDNESASPATETIERIRKSILA